ncbi:MAG: hypothetical protein ABIQ81_00110 [Novosphingobium sp.]
MVNLDEFSELCGVTAETMRVHVRDVEGTPAWLIERGSRGRDYKIDPTGGLAWWKAKREDDENASAERQAELAQLRFDLLGDSVETQEGLTFSGRQRKEEFEAALTRIKLRRTMGELIEVAELEAKATGAVVELRRQLLLLPAEFAVAAGLSPEEVKPLADMIERAVTAFVTGMPSPMKGPVDA